MADPEGDLGACTIEHLATKVTTDINVLPKNKWAPALSDIDAGVTPEGSGSPSLAITQRFHGLEILVQQNLLEALIDAIDQIIRDVSELPEQGAVATLKNVEHRVQALLADTDRNLIVQWSYSFNVLPKKGTYHLKLEHNDTIITSLYKSDAKAPGRMAWGTETLVNFRGERKRLRTAAAGNEAATGARILSGEHEPDAIEVPGGQHTMALTTRLTLKSEGFATELKEAVDQLLSLLDKAVADWLNIENLVEDTIRGWITQHTSTWFGVTTSKPSEAEAEAQRKAERQKRQDDIRRSIKTSLSGGLKALQALLREWQGSIKFQSTSLIISCLSHEAYRKLLERDGDQPRPTLPEPTRPVPSPASVPPNPPTDGKPVGGEPVREPGSAQPRPRPERPGPGGRRRGGG